MCLRGSGGSGRHSRTLRGFQRLEPVRVAAYLSLLQCAGEQLGSPCFRSLCLKLNTEEMQQNALDHPGAYLEARSLASLNMCSQGLFSLACLTHLPSLETQLAFSSCCQRILLGWQCPGLFFCQAGRILAVPKTAVWAPLECWGLPSEVSVNSAAGCLCVSGPALGCISVSLASLALPRHLPHRSGETQLSF